MTDPRLACRPVSLPDRQAIDAARLAIRTNPANAVAVASLGDGLPLDPARLAGLTTKFWRAGDAITWRVIDGASAAVRRLVAEAFARWARHADLRFVESATDPICRIARSPVDGHWSYLGTDNRMIAPGNATMNLAGFTEHTSPAEWQRVADHEIGHLLGLIHGQKTAHLVARLDPAGCYAYFGGPPNRWPRSLVDSEILTPTPMGLLTDFGPAGLATSIMTYSFPASCVRDRVAIPGGSRITEKDAEDVGRIYGRPPGPTGPPPPPDPPPADSTIVLTEPLFGPESLARPVEAIDYHALLEAFNAARLAAGVAELVAVGPLMYAALDQAQWTDRTGRLEHTRPSGYGLAERLEDYRVPWRKCWENVARRFPRVEDLMAAWLGSPGHRAAILAPDAEFVGFGAGGADVCAVLLDPPGPAGVSSDGTDQLRPGRHAPPDVPLAQPAPEPDERDRADGPTPLE